MRWRSAETIRIYGRLGSAEYSGILAQAAPQEATAVQARYLPTTDWGEAEVNDIVGVFASANCGEDPA